MPSSKQLREGLHRGSPARGWPCIAPAFGAAELAPQAPASLHACPYCSPCTCKEYAQPTIKDEPHFASPICNADWNTSNVALHAVDDIKVQLLKKRMERFNLLKLLIIKLTLRHVVPLCIADAKSATSTPPHGLSAESPDATFSAFLTCHLLFFIFGAFVCSFARPIHLASHFLPSGLILYKPNMLSSMNLYTWIGSRPPPQHPSVCQLANTARSSNNRGGVRAARNLTCMAANVSNGASTSVPEGGRRLAVATQLVHASTRSVVLCSEQMKQGWHVLKREILEYAKAQQTQVAFALMGAIRCLWHP